MFMLFVVPSINIDLLNQVSDKKMKLPLPKHLETNGRVCFYGFAVTTEWLVDYAKAHWNNADRYDDFAKVSATMITIPNRIAAVVHPRIMIIK